MTDLLNADVSVPFHDTISLSFQPSAPIEEEVRGGSATRRIRGSDAPRVVLCPAINRGWLLVRHLLCRDTEREGEAVRQEIVAGLQEELEGSRTAEAHTRKACTLYVARFVGSIKRQSDRSILIYGDC